MSLNPTAYNASLKPLRYNEPGDIVVKRRLPQSDTYEELVLRPVENGFLAFDANGNTVTLTQAEMLTALNALARDGSNVGDAAAFRANTDTAKADLSNAEANAVLATKTNEHLAIQRALFRSVSKSGPNDRLHEDFGSSLAAYDIAGDPTYGTVSMTNGVITLDDTSGAGVLSVRPTADQFLSAYKRYVVEVTLIVDSTQKIEFRLIDAADAVAVGFGLDSNNTVFKTLNGTTTTGIAVTGFNRTLGARAVFVIDPIAKRASVWMDYSNAGEQAEILIHDNVAYTNEIVAWLAVTSLGASGDATVSRVRAYYISGAMIGDSIAAGRTGLLPTPGIQSQDWTSCAEYWIEQAQLGTRMVVNWGDSGDTWADTLSKVALVTSIKPDYVVINCGTNDLFANRTFAAMDADRAAVVAAFQAVGCVVVINEVLPRNNFTDTQDTAKTAWNAALLESAKTEGFLVARLHDPFLAAGSTTDISPAYTTDNIHPSVVGYRRMSDLILSAY